MRQLTPDNQSKLVKFLIRDDYIESEDKFDAFVNAISDSFFRQLLDDMTYVYKPGEVDKSYGWGTDKYL